MSSGTIIGIVAVVLVALLLAGVGLFFVLRDDGDDGRRASDRDTTTTEEDDTTTTEEDTTTTEDDTTTTEEDTTTTTEDSTPSGPDDSHSGEIGPDGTDSFTADVVAGGDLLVVTPVGDWDLIIEISGDLVEYIDSGLDGDSESIFLPEGSYTITVSGWLSDDFGGYTATLG